MVSYSPSYLYTSSYSRDAMENNTDRQDIFIKEMPDLSTEPASLGLFGLAVAALILSVTYIGFTESGTNSLLIPWILFFGATTQFVAGLLDYRRKNIFGFTVFTFFSMAMYSIALTAYINVFTDVKVDTIHYAAGLTAVMVFLVIITAASMMTNKTLFAIVISVDIALPILIAHYIWGIDGTIAGLFLLVTSGLSFYAAGGILLNSMAGRTILPLGGPLWKP